MKRLGRPFMPRSHIFPYIGYSAYRLKGPRFCPMKRDLTTSGMTLHATSDHIYWWKVNLYALQKLTFYPRWACIHGPCKRGMNCNTRGRSSPQYINLWHCWHFTRFRIFCLLVKPQFYNISTSGVQCKTVIWGEHLLPPTKFATTTAWFCGRKAFSNLSHLPSILSLEERQTLFILCNFCFMSNRKYEAFFLNEHHYWTWS